MKIAINTCCSGFSLSPEVYEKLGLEWDGYGMLNNKALGIESNDYLQYRSHPALIEAIEAVGEEAASGFLSEIKIVEIPDDVQWEIQNYDGKETVHERHRSWE